MAVYKKTKRNIKRASFAGAALDVFQRITGTDEDHLLLCDLLCNLQHWAKQNEIDFSDALHQSNYHFADEQRGEG